MNGYSSRTTPPYGYDARLPTPASSLAPSPVGKRLVDGYRKDMVSGFATDKPRFNPMNTDHVQSSALVDLKDPIQVHLLTETALIDSKRYEILSQEEVDGLKKQCQSLSQRVEQTRANLTIQSKYRDAAISMAKLYSPTRPEGRRRSILNRNSGGGGGGDGSAREAEAERVASERRCEELATELFDLEKRLTEPQRRLLEHTAGILQLTHGAAKKRGTGALPALNGMPGSPESLYTYSHDHYRDEDLFDDDGPAPPRASASARGRGNTIEVPVRSPIREQTKELRDEVERLREENRALRDDAQRVRTQVGALNREIDELLQESSKPRLPPGLQQRLQGLGGTLREALVASNPFEYADYSAAPVDKPAEACLDYFEQVLDELRESVMAAGSAAAAAAAAQAGGAVSEQAGRRVDDAYAQVRKIMTIANPAYPLDRMPDPAGLGDKLGFLEEALRDLETETTRSLNAARAVTASSLPAGRDDEVEDLLRGLWDSIRSILDEARKRREQRRAAGQLEDDVSGDEMMDIEEDYSLPAFASRVRYIATKASDLREQKTVLHRQIRQQRELNSKLTADGEADLMRMQDELAEARAMLGRAQGEAADAVREAEAATAREAEARLAERTDAVSGLEAERADLQERLARAESAVRELGAKFAGAEAALASLDAQLADAVEAKRFVEDELESKQRELDDHLREREEEVKSGGALRERDEEIERLNVMVVELKTELTFAQAELDGAYGSRQQRAREAAAIKNSQEVVRLETEAGELRTQLAQTVDELEQVTKETLGAEREKVELEARLDTALAVRTTLENEAQELRRRLDEETSSARALVAKLQEQLDSERLKAMAGPGGGSGVVGGRGATMLSEQFRATMREERKKFQEEMRDEQARRRKVEDELARLRRDVAANR